MKKQLVKKDFNGMQMLLQQLREKKNDFAKKNIRLRLLENRLNLMLSDSKHHQNAETNRMNVG